MTDKTERWSRPQLIVLGRGNPQESVLAWCKDGYHNGTGGTSGDDKCALIQECGAETATS